MSDTAKSSAPGAAAEGPKFSDRELQLLGWAMQSLKSGPPEIDYEKLANFASMSNPRSASNAWAGIKKKLMTPTDGSAPPPTPKKGGRKKKADGGEEGEVTPKPKATPRKRANKGADDGDASPKKKGRPAKAKPKQESEDAEDSNVKAESDSADELKPEGDAPMAEAEEEEV